MNRIKHLVNSKNNEVDVVRNTLFYIFIFGFFISVFIFWPYVKIIYEIPKVWFVLRWIEVFAISCFFYIKFLKKEKIDSKLIALVLLFIVTVITSSVFGYDPHKSVVGNYYRLDGIITLFHLIIIFFCVSLFADRRWFVNFVKVASLTAVLLSISSVFQWALSFVGVVNFRPWDGGFGSVFGNPNFLAGYLIVTLPFTAYFLEKGIDKPKFFYLALVIQMVGIFFTKAWVGYFGLLIFLVGLLLVKKKNLRSLILVVGLLLFAILTYAFFIYQKSLESPISINPESRTRIIMKGFLAFKNEPLIGYGLANFDKAFESVDYPIHLEHDVYVDKAHSSLLEILVTTGIVGAIIYVGIILRTVFNLLRSGSVLHRYYLWTFVLLILHMQTNVISISEELLFWIIAGFSTKEL